MNKNVFFGISIVINIILLIAVIGLAGSAYHKMKFATITEDEFTVNSLKSSLESERYGDTGAKARSIRAGAKVSKEEVEYYKLGEYADLLFMREVFAKTGKTESYEAFDKQAAEIKESMPDYAPVFDKIDYSIEHAGFTSSDADASQQTLEN